MIKCHQNGSNDEQIHQTARALEQLLFKQAKDLRSYQDKNTLEDRLRGLMTVLVRKKMMNRAKTGRKERARILIQILGPHRYKHCTELVRKIKTTMSTKVPQLKCNPQYCTRRLDTKLPSVVRVLYFETLLVNAFEKYSIHRLASIDWDALIEQAAVNLQEFQMWENEHEPIT
jgi:hypothetical protein